MAKAVKKDVEAWLLSFEKAAGTPIVIALLVERGDVSLMNIMPKKRYLGDIDEPEDDEGEAGFSVRDVEKLRNKGSFRSSGLGKERNYIG